MKKGKKPLTLYAIAHTQSFYNHLHIFAGRKDSRLTPLGHRNAEMLAKKLKGKDIGFIYVSPLLRARETARYVHRYYPDAKVIIDKRLMERDYGKLSGKSKDKFAREHPDLWPLYHRSYTVPPPGGESIKQLEKRALSLLREIVPVMRKAGKSALIVAHSNTLRPIRRRFEKLTPQEMMKLEGQYNKIYSYKIR